MQKEGLRSGILLHFSWCVDSCQGDGQLDFLYENLFRKIKLLLLPPLSEGKKSVGGHGDIHVEFLLRFVENSLPLIDIHGDSSNH